MKPQTPSPILVFGALIFVQVLFGLNYVLSKVVVDVFPPLVWASARIIIAAIIMVGIAFFSGTDAPKPDRKFFIPLIAFSLLGIIINQSSFLVGLHYTTSTNSAILNTLIPVVTLMIVTFRGQEPLTLKRGLGFISAFAGVLVIRKVENFSLSNPTLIGDLLTILNCISYGFFLAYSKPFFQKYNRMWATAWMFLYGSVGLTLLATPQWFTFEMPVLTPVLIGCMIFGVLGATVLTYFLNFWALAYARSSSVALFIYLQPIVAAALAWFWFQEPPTARTLISSLLIFCGVLLGLSREPAKAPIAVQEVRN